MRCVASTCGNIGNSTAEEISYFKFPTDWSLRRAWLVALHIEDWQLDEHSVVCSKHFVKGDLLTSCGLSKLQTGAVPVVDVLNVSMGDSTATCDVKVCRICFARDCKLYTMTSHKILYKAYETLTGLLLENEVNLPPFVCTECSHQLLRCSRFRTRSLQSHLVLLEIVKKHDCVTLESIQSVIGVQNPLSSNLIHNEVERFDLDMELLEKDKVNTDKHIHSRDLQRSRNNIPIVDIKVENDKVILIGDINVKIQADSDDLINSDIRTEDTITDVIHDMSSLRNDIIIKTENNDLIVPDIVNKGSTNNVAIDMSSLHSNVTVKMEEVDLITPDIHNEYSTNGEMPESAAFDFVKVENISALNPDSDTKELEYNHDIDENLFAGEDCASNNTLPLEVQQKASTTGPLEQRTEDMEHTKMAIARIPKTDIGLLTNKRLSCDICPYQTISATQLMSHLKAHAATTSFSCNACNYITISKDNMECHMRVHSGEKPYSCNVCKKAFNRKTDLRQHMRIHTGVKPYSCGVCNRAFHRKSDLNKHARIHSGEKPFSCNICNETFSRKCYLQYHLSVHYGKQYYCDICNKGFKRRDNLKQHLRTHYETKPHTCNVCNKGFIKKIHLESHLRRHCEEKPYLCHVCNIQCNSKGDLGVHLRLHPSAKTYSCNICNKTFCRNITLQTHLRIHAEKTHTCNICDKAFKSSAELQIHLRIHAGEKPYPCNVCNKAYNRNNELQIHLRTHTGEKPYPCNVCNKAFVTKSRLHRHLQIHNRDKPYSCNMCNIAYHRQCDLKVHFRTHTGDKLNS